MQNVSERFKKHFVCLFELRINFGSAEIAQSNIYMQFKLPNCWKEY